MKKEVKAQKVEKAYKQFKAALSPREKEIVSKYYGLERNVRHTLLELGELFKVTRERIRQIKFEALRKIKVKK